MQYKERQRLHLKMQKFMLHSRRGSKSDKIETSFCEEGFEAGCVKVGEWSGDERLLSIMEDMSLVRSNLALLRFSRNMAWSNPLFCVNQDKVEG